MEQVNTGFIGCGAMGSAIIKGIINNNIISPENIWGYDLSRDKTENLKNNFGINIASNYAELCENSKQIFLAVKPADFKTVMREIKAFINKDHTVISIAAGISTAFMESVLGEYTRIIRLMPNTPCLIGEGVIAVSPGKYALNDDVDKVERMVRSLGHTLVVKEKHMNAVTALSGSGPAYAYLFMEALVDGGVSAGLDRRTATELAAQTLSGAAKMVQTTGKTLPELKYSVTSPGGTTIAALNILEENAFRGTVINAVAGAVRRAKELEGN